MALLCHPLLEGTSMLSQPTAKDEDSHGCGHLLKVSYKLANIAAVNKAGFDLNYLTISGGNSNLSKAKTTSL